MEWANVKCLAVAVALVVLLAGCSSVGGSPKPSGGAAAPYVLRATQHQSIPPESQFTWLPYALITADGVVVSQGPMPAIFPGPLLPNLQGAPISEAGYDGVVERAHALGLLDGEGDFRPPKPMPGSLSGLIELRVDGLMRRHRLRRSARSGASWATCARWSATSLGRTPHITPRAMPC